MWAAVLMAVAIVLITMASKMLLVMVALLDKVLIRLIQAIAIALVLAVVAGMVEVVPTATKISITASIVVAALDS